MIKSLLACALVLGLTMPAFAAEEFFVALDTTAKQCRVMMTQPDGVIMRKVGSAAYSSLDEAQAAISNLPECRS